MSPILSWTPRLIRLKQWLARSRAWISLLVLIPIGTACVFSRPNAAIDSWADFGFETLGWLLFSSGVALRWWATLYIAGRKTDELICDGPYSICRNPIYCGTFLLTLSVAVFMESLTFTVAVIVVSLSYFFTTVFVEEAKLRSRHGGAFTTYCQRVPRMIPRLRGYSSPSSVELRLDGVHAEFIRTLRYAWVPIAGHLVSHLRAHDWWPILSNLP
jgi:protein-S-isoprenylcysteine O-methyltransferase Ste14